MSMKLNWLTFLVCMNFWTSDYAICQEEPGRKSMLFWHTCMTARWLSWTSPPQAWIPWPWFVLRNWSGRKGKEGRLFYLLPILWAWLRKLLKRSYSSLRVRFILIERWTKWNLPIRPHRLNTLSPQFYETMIKILKYSFFDLIRSRWSFIYFLFYLMSAGVLLFLSGDISKALISLLNIIIILSPLIGTLFGIMYFYNSREFAELLLAQPVKRTSIFFGQYLGSHFPCLSVLPWEPTFPS